MDPTKPVKKSKSAFLPHWRQDGGTYAVTFRQVDSIPAPAAERLAVERRALERELKLLGDLSDEAYVRLDRLHSEAMETLLNNCHGSCALRSRDAAAIVDESLRHFEGQRYGLAAFAIMPNHVHAVVRPTEEFGLDVIVQTWKSFTSRKINGLLGRTGQFWQPDYYDHLIRNSADFEHAVRYTLSNPQRAGLRDWSWVYLAEGLREWFQI